MRAVFAAVDTDGDGALDEAELASTADPNGARERGFQTRRVRARRCHDFATLERSSLRASDDMFASDAPLPNIMPHFFKNFAGEELAAVAAAVHAAYPVRPDAAGLEGLLRGALGGGAASVAMTIGCACAIQTPD